MGNYRLKDLFESESKLGSYQASQQNMSDSGGI